METELEELVVELHDINKIITEYISRKAGSLTVRLSKGQSWN